MAVSNTATAGTSIPDSVTISIPNQAIHILGFALYRVCQSVLRIEGKCSHDSSPLQKSVNKVGIPFVMEPCLFDNFGSVR
jgi:hypothetical protein